MIQAIYHDISQHSCYLKEIGLQEQFNTYTIDENILNALSQDFSENGKIIYDNKQKIQNKYSPSNLIIQWILYISKYTLPQLHCSFIIEPNPFKIYFIFFVNLIIFGSLIIYPLYTIPISMIFYQINYSYQDIYKKLQTFDNEIFQILQKYKQILLQAYFNENTIKVQRVLSILNSKLETLLYSRAQIQQKQKQQQNKNNVFTINTIKKQLLTKKLNLINSTKNIFITKWYNLFKLKYYGFQFMNFAKKQNGICQELKYILTTIQTIQYRNKNKPYDLEKYIVTSQQLYIKILLIFYSKIQDKRLLAKLLLTQINAHNISKNNKKQEKNIQKENQIDDYYRYENHQSAQRYYPSTNIKSLYFTTDGQQQQFFQEQREDVIQKIDRIYRNDQQKPQKHANNCQKYEQQDNQKQQEFQFKNNKKGIIINLSQIKLPKLQIQQYYI